MASTPRVSVVVLNYDGLEHVDECFASLRELTYPRDSLEVMLVDNGSTDGSPEHVEEAFPEVRVVRLGANVGFAAGNNRGAEAATADYIVFLNNDTAVEPPFVTELVSAVTAEPDVVCAGAKILDWSGERIDFGGSTVNFAGHAAQLGMGAPAAASEFDVPRPILFACGGAMIIERDAFLAGGGFDEDYFLLFEDVDLGWRLWVLGHRVVYAPRARVRHRHHGTLDRLPEHRYEVLLRRNALDTIVKNYGDEALVAALPAALLALGAGVAECAADGGSLDLRSFALTSDARGDATPVRIDRCNAASLVALHEFARNLSKTMAKRRAVQERRRRPDAEIVALMRPYHPPVPWTWPETAYAAGEALGVHELFAAVPKRVLVVSADRLPSAGARTGDAGLRAWGLGQGLRARGHDVVFSMPRRSLNGLEDRVPADSLGTAWQHHRIGETIASVAPDVVVLCGSALSDHLAQHPRIRVPLILDEPGPNVLDRDFHGLTTPGESPAERLRALREADAFTCVGNRQHEHFQRWLRDAGWTDDERRDLTGVVPACLDPELPAHDPRGEISFVANGTFLPWRDSGQSLRVLVHELEARGMGRLHVIDGDDARPAGAQHVRLPEDVAHSARVTTARAGEDDVSSLLSRAHVAIELVARSAARELAVPMRAAVFLWSGLPVIYDDYSELSGYIRDYDAGWTLDPLDARALRSVVCDILEQPELVAAKSRNAQRLARERLAWTHAIDALDRLVRRPRLRRLRQSPRPEAVPSHAPPPPAPSPALHLARQVLAAAVRRPLRAAARILSSSPSARGARRSPYGRTD